MLSITQQSFTKQLENKIRRKSEERCYCENLAYSSKKIKIILQANPNQLEAHQCLQRKLIQLPKTAYKQQLEQLYQIESQKFNKIKFVSFSVSSNNIKVNDDKQNEQIDMSENGDSVLMKPFGLISNANKKMNDQELNLQTIQGFIQNEVALRLKNSLSSYIEQNFEKQLNNSLKQNKQFLIYTQKIDKLEKLVSMKQEKMNKQNKQFLTLQANYNEIFIQFSQLNSKFENINPSEFLKKDSLKKIEAQIDKIKQEFNDQIISLEQIAKKSQIENSFFGNSLNDQLEQRDNKVSKIINSQIHLSKMQSQLGKDLNYLTQQIEIIQNICPQFEQIKEQIEIIKSIIKQEFDGAKYFIDHLMNKEFGEKQANIFYKLSILRQDFENKLKELQTEINHLKLKPLQSKSKFHQHQTSGNSSGSKQTSKYLSVKSILDLESNQAYWKEQNNLEEDLTKRQIFKENENCESGKQIEINSINTNSTNQLQPNSSRTNTNETNKSKQSKSNILKECSLNNLDTQCQPFYNLKSPDVDESLKNYQKPYKNIENHSTHNCQVCKENTIPSDSKSTTTNIKQKQNKKQLLNLMFQNPTSERFVVRNIQQFNKTYRDTSFLGKPVLQQQLTPIVQRKSALDISQQSDEVVYRENESSVDN